MPPAASTVILVVLQFMLLCAPAFGQGTPGVRLPLQGYFRAGKCMPVLIQATSDSLALRLSGPNIVPVEVPAGWSGAVPVMILAEAAEPVLIVEMTGAQTERLPLHPLMADQRLIAAVYHGAALPSEVFDAHPLLSLDLADADLLNMTLIPNNALDGIVVEQIDLKSIPQIIAAGISVILHGDPVSSSSFTWKKVSGYSVLNAPNFGPTSSIGGEAAYLPTQAWVPGPSAGLRHQVLLAGILISLLISGALLLRRASLQLLGITTIALLGCVAIGIWRQRISSIESVSGNVTVHFDGAMQLDHWQYLAAGASGGDTITQPMLPILFDVDQANKINLKLICEPGGQFRWSFTLQPNGRLALRSRSIMPNYGEGSLDRSLSSPLYELARQSYLQPGLAIKGYASTPGNAWGTIVVGPD